MSKKKVLTVEVDGVHFNATHYVSKGKSEGVAALEKDHEQNEHTRGFDFEKVYEALEAKLAEEEAKEEETFVAQN